MHRRLQWLLALNLFLFVLFSWGVMTTPPFLTAMDEWGMKITADSDDQTTIQIARFFSIVTSYKVCLTTGFIVSFIFIYLNKYRTSFFILLGAACTKLISAGLKGFFSRERPLVDSFVSVNGGAFPSAHMIYAVFLTGSLFILFSVYLKRTGRGILMLGGFLVVGMVGWSRVHLGAHYISDVLGGFSIGVVWLLVMYLLSQKKISNDVRREDS
ncbi:phosphatase PAP2 family protein [Halobacillus trueperi]|uniref:PAP2 family protein n=1 Tax=Halobacillus trueperi TaxID=156205 RepID=A0A3E0JDQ8_9BACI|nr:phosphatase PAP2 family protein [Halobacillus trueperi]REJ10980.1 PAP2 family protein [Halobacillus trueperi]